MADSTPEELPNAQKKRLQPFLDCVARLLAKRWLRNQRQDESAMPENRVGQKGPTDAQPDE